MDTEMVFQRFGRDLMRVRVERAETYIGKHPVNDVVVPDAATADVAALMLDLGGGRYRVRMLDGRPPIINGSTVDADTSDVRLGDVFEIGAYHVRLETKPIESFAQGQRNTETMTRGSPRLHPPAEQARLNWGNQVVKLRGDKPFNIGTDLDNDLVLQDPFVSSFHCRVLRRDDRWTLVDLASTNGTFVGGLRVGETELPTRAHIMIGQHEFSFEHIQPSDQPETRAAPRDMEVFGGMISTSGVMRRTFEQIRKLASARATVLVTGPSGTGKELVARALHDASARAAGPYLALNCGAFSAALIEGELFGHVRGAFTGADREKKGAFEAAEGGTLFLDEIGELPLELQPKLLRVLETSTVRRVGGTTEIPVNTRIVAATLRNLEQLAQDGKFREDLLHRLNVLTIRVPALAERPEDILPLTHHFLTALSPPGRKLSLTRDAERLLEGHAWPGNVRELRNVVLRAVLTSDQDLLDAGDLELARDARALSLDPRKLVARLDDEERARILRAMEETRDNRAEAARLLGLSKSTFHDKLKRLGIPLKSDKKPTGP